MAVIVNWPGSAAFVPRALRFGASTPKSAFAAFFTGQVQSLGHLADRLRATITLPPCDPAAAQQREAYLMELASTGNWVRLQHQHRLEPLGTMRGSPTVLSNTAAGARNVSVASVAGATLLAGDVISIGNQLLMVGYAGAVADGSGNAVVPLVLPLAQAVAAAAPVVWSQPTGTFQLAGVDGLDVDYGRGRWQGQLEISLLQAL